MENLTPSTGKFALTYGLIMGGIGIVFALMLYSADMHYQGGLAVMGVSLVITIGVIILALIQFRKANNGFMSLAQALKVGIGTCLIGGIIGIVFNLFMMTVIDPEMMNKAMASQREQMIATYGMTPDQADQQLEMGKKFSSPAMQIVFGLVYSLFIGFVVSLIGGFILRREQNLN